MLCLMAGGRRAAQWRSRGDKVSRSSGVNRRRLECNRDLNHSNPPTPVEWWSTFSTGGPLQLMNGDWISTAGVRREVDKEVYEVMLELEAEGWRFRRQSHKFKAYCPCETEPRSTIRINGTPRNAGNHAKSIRREVADCPDHARLR